MAKSTSSRKKTTTKKKTTATKKKPTTKKSTSTRKKTTTRKKPTSRKTTTRRSSTRKSTKKKDGFTLTNQTKALIVGITLIFATVILLLSLVSPNQGLVTQWFSERLKMGFGWGNWVVPIAMGAGGFYLVLWGMDQPPSLPVNRLVGLGLLFLSIESLLSIFAWGRSTTIPRESVFDIAQRGAGGGYFGSLLSYLTIEAVGNLGSAFLFLMLSLVGLVLVTGVTRGEMGLFFRRIMSRPARADDELIFQEAPANPTRIKNSDTRAKITERPSRKKAKVTEPDILQDQLDQARAVRDKRATIKPREAAKIKRTNSERVSAEPTSLVTVPTRGGKGQWELPSIAGMLDLGLSSEIDNTSVHEQSAIIESTLESFGAPVQTVEINAGPTVTQFGVEPMFIEQRNGRRTKVKVSKIAGLADDLALALAAKSVRIQAPVPGKGYVGIEVPNTSKVSVSLRDVMESKPFHKIKSPLRVGLGEDVAGNPAAADLAKMPHLLIAGATGSGKSVCVNGIIACLLLQNTPDDLRFVMVDPKRVELTGYNGIPHLAAPVVVQMDRVVGVLQWALREMDQRYQTFATVGSRNIKTYNEKAKKLKKEKLPYIVIIIDELADLMMTAPEDTERALARLAQMARATGIHMIIATQRPSVDVVTGLIKANFPARIAFAVSSSTDSRVVLDTVGAERLLGAGDMLFQRPDAPAPIRMQGCFVSDDELNKIITYWKSARRFYKYTTEQDAEPAVSTPSTPVIEKPLAKTVAPPPSIPAPAPAPKREPTPLKPAPSPKPKTTISPSEQSEPISGSKATESPANGVSQSPISNPQSPTPQPLWDHLIDLDAEAEANTPHEVDELWDEAVAFVRKSGKASTSLLQRKFRIGYTRSARIIDAMEDNGIIGPPTGTSKAREVIPEENDQLEMNNE